MESAIPCIAIYEIIHTFICVKMMCVVITINSFNYFGISHKCTYDLMYAFRVVNRREIFFPFLIHAIFGIFSEIQILRSFRFICIASLKILIWGWGSCDSLASNPKLANLILGTLLTGLLRRYLNPYQKFTLLIVLNSTIHDK